MFPPRRRRLDSFGKDAHLKCGKEAEDRVATYLGELGYRIIERNYRIRQGEIDLIAWDGEFLCFIEVRSRRDTSRGDPLETVGARKQRKLIHTARHYLMGIKGTPPRIRFDVVGVIFEPHLELRLVRDAFQVASAW